MIKKQLMFILFLCVCSSVLAINSGENFQITNIQKCYGKVDIKIWGVVNITDNGFTFQSCQKVGYDRWQCNCNENNYTPIVLTTKNYTANIYDVIIEYYISPKVDVGGGKYDNDINSRRTSNFNNLRVGPEPVKKEIVKFKMPEINIGGVFMGAIAVLIVTLIFVTYYIWKYFLIDEVEEETDIGYFTKRRHKAKELKTGDKEIDDLIKKL